MGLTRINFSNIDTVNANANFSDPTLMLSHNFTGTPTNDSGIIIGRGTELNVGIIWDESSDSFALIKTPDVGETKGDTAISSYADLTVGNLQTTGNVVINGNLTVDGEVTTINSSITSIDDINIVLASGAISSSEADGAGLTIDGANATLVYDSTTDSWVVNKNLTGVNITATTVTASLSGHATTASTVTDASQPNITSVGTLTSATVSGNLSAGNVDTSGTLSSANLSSETGTISTLTVDTLASITATTASMSTTTGALKVAGGAGIVGNVYVGGQIQSTGLISANYVTATTATFTGTEAIKLPVGTTAQRPSSPAEGMFRFNSQTNGFELYDGTQWSSASGITAGGSTGELQYNSFGNFAGIPELTYDGTNLTAGNLTATGSFTGNLTGDVTGNVSGSSSKWNTARSITLTGDVTGSVNIDGSTNVILTTTIADDSHAHVIANIDGLGTALANAESSAVATANAYTDTAIQNLIAASPGTLDTLNEIAAALNNDANFATTITNALTALQNDLDNGTLDGGSY